MDTSMRLSAAEPTALQAATQLRRANAPAEQAELATPGIGAAVQVSISEQGRAAEQAARLEGVPTTAPQQAPAVAASPVPPTADAAALRPSASAVATPGPASDPQGQQQLRASAESRGVSNAQLSAERAPDAAAADTSASVQLYLENASRPAAQAGPSAVRTSA